MEGLVNFRDWYFPTSSIIAILHLIEWSDLVNCLSHDDGCCIRARNYSYHCWRSMCWHLLDLVLTNVTLVHQWQACVSQFCNNLSSFIFQILTGLQYFHLQEKVLSEWTLNMNQVNHHIYQIQNHASNWFLVKDSEIFDLCKKKVIFHGFASERLLNWLSRWLFRIS